MVGGKKEIVYANIDRFAEIVATGEYRGVKYICVNRGIHPCAYVLCSQEFLDKHTDAWNSIPEIHVHGGVTYVGLASDLLGLEDFPVPCFGWDYGHFGDWEGYRSEEQNRMYGHRKYTTDMIIKECESAIDQYLEVLSNDEKCDEEGNLYLNSDILEKFGFTPVFNGSDQENAYRISGEEDGRMWKIYVDLKHKSLSYALNQDRHRKYDGEIVTVKDLKLVIQMCNIPLVID